ncbi:serine hydrolase domain-containing protein [Bacillus pseudomycoides]|uniref:Penicillin-binding protein n=1 Tax=Bacillus pseudomycoides TaxID=64104 RepID=A0A2B6QTV8_9BACI|nr:serine hydrolase domain-containing protein [Bacillus pseudomycoides]PDY45978.1 penicillin-binding protein [Bacillus pseudomycoides]PEA83429.1 penicillin-binding protein [Bacillus pseudomycoides]PED07890.1 penicillin-binding protein [Bacillus pseudomycoides]PED69037.1 penicillin-binding protein [Bacillus pseudomycoides]PEI36834.1 penicillin-binding protein [Bacillus pseudomycoides]
MELKTLDIYEKMKQYPVAGLSLAIIRNGKLEYAEGFGSLEFGTARKVNVNSIFNACSISKFLTAMLVLKLANQGILNLDEDVNNKLVSWKVPENKFTSSKKVTLRNLLSHQSGIIDPDKSFDIYNPIQGKPTILQILQGKTSYCSVPIEVQYEPESNFHYSDAGFCIIEQLLEDVCGKPFDQLLQEEIFEPLSMNNSTLECPTQNITNERFACGHDKDGHVIDGKYPFYPYSAAAGIWSTPTDLAALVMEIIHSLQGNSKLELSSKIMKEIISPQGCSKWTGLGVFLDNPKQEIQISSLGWGVGFQCMIVAYPYRGTGAVIMTNSDLGVHQNEGIIGEIVNLLKL